MLNFIREELQFILLVLLWVLVAIYLGPVAYAFLPLTVFAMKSREQWSEMIFGMLIVLVLSDVNKAVLGMRVFKDVKNFYVVALALFLFLERRRFVPLAGVFPLFLPFFVYSVYPLVYSGALGTGIQKTLSYALMFLIVPNYVLYNYRRQGWDFFRNLMFFITAILVMGFLMKYIYPAMTQVGGRFNGLFGNPNGLGIFCYLSMMLFGVLTAIKKDLFDRREQIFIVVVIFYFLILSGSRASLTATLIFILFNRFFRYSPFLGFVILILLIGALEVIGRNLEPIILALGLEEYLRLRTLEDGSGRYFAWNFAWEKIQDYFIFGGGFANDETVMRRNYAYLEKMGHQGGVHNSYLSMWFNVGIIGLFIYFRSFILLFIKASKLQPVSLAALFSVLFSIMYESWLVGSLNPYTIMLLIVMTVTSEEEIARWEDQEEEAPEEEAPDGPEEAPTFRPVSAF
ncbi:MAG: O-antigen ligase family protein [Flavobacteriales bacterium]|nr:O-antigen ligase family protein [Flavobacteriales bacterium]